jgi:hypothetical protein
MAFRESYYKRDVDGLVIKEDAMGFLAMSAEALALAGCHDNGGGGVELLLVQSCQKLAMAVSARDAGIVGRSGRVRIDLNRGKMGLWCCGSARLQHWSLTDPADAEWVKSDGCR